MGEVYLPRTQNSIAKLLLNILTADLAAKYWAGIYTAAPELDDLRSDQRFKEMLKPLNLPE